MNRILFVSVSRCTVHLQTPTSTNDDDAAIADAEVRLLDEARVEVAPLHFVVAFLHSRWRTVFMLFVLVSDQLCPFGTTCLRIKFSNRRTK